MKTLSLILALLCSPAFATEKPVDSWSGSDKALHFGVSAVVGFAAVNQWPDNKPKAFLVAMIPGVLKEVSDRKTTGFSGKDLVADALGVALGVYAGGWLISRNQGTTKVAYAATF
jgi:uncharacterized protein YfiM (DUF2279 family)